MASDHHGYKPGGKIVLAPHNEAWAAAFDAESSAIIGALSDLRIELHHIGSTAIPGIVAKPVIDMLGIVESVAQLDARVHSLVAIGYEALGEFGIPGRRSFRKSAADGTRTHQLHAFATGSAEIDRHLNFRDYLRAFPREAEAYVLLKQRLAAGCDGDMRFFGEFREVWEWRAAETADTR